MRKRLLLSSFVLLLLLSACAAAPEDVADENSTGENYGGEISEERSPEADNKSPLLLYEDDLCKVEYIEVFDYSELYGEDVQDLGVCYLRLKVENKSDQTFTVYMTDLYVNGTSTQALRGVPMELAPGTNSLEPFFFNYASLEISERAEIKTIKFKIMLQGENAEILLETDPVTIEF